MQKTNASNGKYKNSDNSVDVYYVCVLFPFQHEAINKVDRTTHLFATQGVHAPHVLQTIMIEQAEAMETEVREKEVYMQAWRD